MYNWQEKSLIDEVKDLIARVENSVNNEWVTLKDKKGEPYHVNIDEEEKTDKTEDKLPYKNFKRLSHEERKERVKEINKYYKAGKLSENEILQLLSQSDDLKWDVEKQEFVYTVDDLTAKRKEKAHEEKVKKMEEQQPKQMKLFNAKEVFCEVLAELLAEKVCK